MPDSGIEILVDRTKCDRKLAAVMLEFTDGNVEKAENIIRSMPKDIAVVTFRFTSEHAGRFGVGVLVYNLHDGHLERNEVLVSGDTGVYDIDLDAETGHLVEQVREYARHPDTDQENSKTLKDLVTAKDFLDELAKLSEDRQTTVKEDLKALFDDHLSRVLEDLELKIEVNARFIDSFQYYRGEKEFVEREQNQVEEAAEEEKNDVEPEKKEWKNESIVILNTQPVISPVTGKPIPKLKAGDTIFVQITDKREIGSYLKKLLHGEMERSGKYEHLAADVEELEYSTNTENVNLFVKFGPGVYGRLLVPRDLKIQVPVEVQEEEQADKLGTWFIWIGVIGLILFILFMTVFRN